MRGAVAVAVLLWTVPAAAASYATEPLFQNGPVANRFNLAVLGDGYTAAQQDKLRSDALTVIQGLFGVTPYSDYQDYFNATLVHVTSAQSGADHPEVSPPQYVDTALDATYDCGGVPRLICINTDAVTSIAATAVPSYDVAIVVVNDNVYGGSGGVAPVVSTNSQAVEILRHEMGHTLGNLADEYSAADPGYPPCDPTSDCPEPNVTLRTQRSQIKWQPWILDATPLPTPATSPYETGVVGLFEGARYQTQGVYRPQFDCRMRDLGVPFCAVCTQALILQIYNRVAPVDTDSPLSPVTMAEVASQRFHVTHPQTVPPTVVVSWLVDGSAAGSGDSITLQGGDLGLGDHQVQALVQDDTTLVRTAPAGLMWQSVSWQVHVQGAVCGDGIVEGGEQCDDGVNDGRYGGCNADCTRAAYCGDGIVNGPELCDDGNQINGDGCSAACKPDSPSPSHGCACAGDPSAAPPSLAWLVLVGLWELRRSRRRH